MDTYIMNYQELLEEIVDQLLDEGLRNTLVAVGFSPKEIHGLSKMRKIASDEVGEKIKVWSSEISPKHVKKQLDSDETISKEVINYGDLDIFTKIVSTPDYKKNIPFRISNSYNYKNGPYSGAGSLTQTRQIINQDLKDVKRSKRNAKKDLNFYNLQPSSTKKDEVIAKIHKHILAADNGLKLLGKATPEIYLDLYNEKLEGNPDLKTRIITVLGHELGHNVNKDSYDDSHSNVGLFLFQREAKAWRTGRRLAKRAGIHNKKQDSLTALSGLSSYNPKNY
jgi:hypothetical protein